MIIDHLYEDVISKLTAQFKIKDISNQLLSLTSNNERVLFVYEVINGLNSFPQIQKVEKSVTMSTYYRNQGNKCYQSSQDSKAWQYYNLSLLNSPLNSSNYYLALSNRSAVYFSMKKYRECLNDIRATLLLKIPQELNVKLSKRKEMCEQALLKEAVKDDIPPELNNILTMKCSKDSRYLSASSKLEVTCTEEMGRLVLAKEDISTGEILVDEEPYFTLLLKEQFLFSCAYCLSRSLNLSPCENCCYVLYCSNECNKNALKEYHAVECPLMATLFDMDFTKIELLALRTVIKARNDHKDWSDLLKTVEDIESNMDNEFRGHIKCGEKWVFDSKNYATIHTLESNINRRSISDIFQKAVTAAVFLKFLSDHSTFLQESNNAISEKVRNSVAGMLLLHLMTSPTNMHGISATIQSSAGTFTEELSLASAPYGFHSLLNHSCAPNVVRFSKLGSSRMMLIALRPIKKGMQLFDNYGQHHALEDRHTRQAGLMFQYKFYCTCEACVNNWPTYLYMGPSSIIPSRLVTTKNKLLSNSIINKLKSGDMDTALKFFKSLCSLCTHFEPYAPCAELCECQEALKQCLAIFTGLLPYGNKLMVPWTAYT